MRITKKYQLFWIGAIASDLYHVIRGIKQGNLNHSIQFLEHAKSICDKIKNDKLRAEIQTTIFEDIKNNDFKIARKSLKKIELLKNKLTDLYFNFLKKSETF